jgi:hypothetical protein
MDDRIDGQQRAQHFDDRITNRDRRLAGRAFAAEGQPRKNRNVLAGGNLMAARRTLRTRHDQVIRGLFHDCFAAQFRALRLPAAVEHLGRR